MLYRVLVLIGWPVAWALFRPRIEGRDRLPASGFVVAPNHLSGFDAVAVAFALPGRRVSNMAKVQLFARPLLGPLVRSLGAFPARSAEGRTGGVEAAIDLARRGNVIAIFPEGARRRSDRVHRPRTGAARVALEAGVPLVPAALRGTDRWRRLGRWQVVFGEPVETADLHTLSTEDAAREATRRVWERVTELERSIAA
jgi:1-acyl-sn-glycerol-3-phosphate acyltransferase